MRADGLPEPEDTTDLLSNLRNMPVEGALCRACRKIKPLIDTIHTPYCKECVEAASRPQE